MINPAFLGGNSLFLKVLNFGHLGEIFLLFISKVETQSTAFLLDIISCKYTYFLPIEWQRLFFS